MGTVSEIPDLKFPDDRFRRPRNFAAVPMFPTFVPHFEETRELMREVIALSAICDLHRSPTASVHGRLWIGTL